MLTIYFSICILFLSSTISSIPTPVIVYSAVIHNVQDSPIQCHITWLQPSRIKLQSDPFTVEKNNYYVVNEKLIDMGTWTARAIIKKIRCNDLVLTAPFLKVRFPSVNWEFRVEPDRIVSVGPSSYVSQDN